LHLGSLVAATGSFLDARRCGGRWLLRIEDLDHARNQPGAADAIVATLQAFGLRHDGEVVRQSARLPLYRAALDELERHRLLFACACSRREIAAVAAPGDEPRCVGRCRELGLDPQGAALRVDLRGLPALALTDRSGREVRFDPGVQTDVVVRRRDGVVAYQLAVVVDDAAQGITDVVRGGDLLSSTGWQLALQHALGLPTPRYLHLPVITESDGSKLAKSRHSLALAADAAPSLILQALELLGQPPPPAAACHAPEALWDWAIAHWDPSRATRRVAVGA
jgi:glutamyl-Q tRNA(Asp) synthetase